MADRFIKICGLQDLASARVAVDAGADALGFVLAESRRRVSSRVIAAIRDELGGGTPPIVGVFVNSSAAEMNRAAETAGLDKIQLSGDERPEILRDLNRPVIKALRFPTGTSVEDGCAEVDAWLSGPHPAEHVIVEGHATGSYGGTGTRADWDLAREIAARYPIILAGGLNPRNVAEAIAHVQPWGVDVSSGVELAHRKHPELIRSFIAEARR